MRMTGKYLYMLGLCLFIAVCLPSVLIAASPTEELKPKLNQVMSVITDASLAGEDRKKERRAKIMAIVKQGFDFTEMSKRVLGKPWNDIDQQQRDHFQRLFTNLLENAYIGKLEGYSGQEIVFTDERVKGKKAVVSTTIEHQGATLPMHYIMIDQAEGWMVYDINIEGVSLVQNYREQFKHILRKEKFEGLVKLLEEKNASFTSEDS